MKMNFPKQLLALCGAVVIIAGASSCKKDNTPPAPTPLNVVQTAQADSTFSLLVTAVTRAGLANALSTTNNITVFAPRNAAFRAAGINESNINLVPLTLLDSVLKYHVIAERIPSSAITTTNIEKTTLNGTTKIYASKVGSNVFINGKRVTAADVSCTNGVIHVVESILLPPTGNLRQTAIANPNFSLLVAAVLRADSTDNLISNALTGSSPLTLFAPTNAAFTTLGFSTPASFNTVSALFLRGVLLYHAVAGRVFSSDLTNNLTVPTALGPTKTVTFNLTSGAQVTGQGNGGNRSNITGVDIMATNGVIHVIDRVLLPQ